MDMWAYIHVEIEVAVSVNDIRVSLWRLENGIIVTREMVCDVCEAEDEILFPKLIENFW